MRGLTSAATWVVVADVSRRKSCPTARRLSNNGLRSGWRESLKFARTDVRGYVVVRRRQSAPAPKGLERRLTLYFQR